MTIWITSSDIATETWRYLMELANPEYAFSSIVTQHGEPVDKDQRKNYQKQAKQLRVALLQAKEYFQAAESASAATSPNHLYYGLVSLATAVMLLRGDGTKSLDYLRRDPINHSHGLRFSTGATNASAQSGLSILQDTRVEVSPRGHFANWYATLPEQYPNFGLQKIRTPLGVNSTRVQLGIERPPTFQTLVGRRETLMSLLETLPDLNQTLRRYNAGIPSSRVSYECELQVQDVPGPVKQMVHKWRFHSAGSPLALTELLEKFTAPPGQDLRFDCQYHEGTTSCVVYYRSPYVDDQFSFPSIREDMNLNSICYAKETLQPEFVDAYRIGYGLSMLARYHPDIWIDCIESHCLATKVIDRYVDVMIERAPILAARLLTTEDLVISTQKPFWHE